MIGITILGATGSIGQSTLDVIARHPDHFRVVAMTANHNVARMAELCRQWKPEFAVMADNDASNSLKDSLQGENITILAGAAALEEVSQLGNVDYVMAAIVGAAGLLSTLAAAKAGKRVLLANKEALVMSGGLFMDTVKSNNAELLPIDSEHNAVFQCMPVGFSESSQSEAERSGIERILLTASGGPFRNTPIEQLTRVTPEQAVAHPNWDMGQKISVDSATMMNKGLEVIEAHWLFSAAADMIQVVIHPQSIIHSMVSYSDGSVLAQLGNPDMRTPIAHAMAWPERIDSGVEALDIFSVAHLDFEQPDLDRFPCLGLAYDALTTGGTAPAILNAANEVAVDAFLTRRLGFMDISNIIDSVLQSVAPGKANSLETILDADRQARISAEQQIKKLSA
ncbi:MAG: 1-deoxy-D-xylulose-5-phosphate reductoisomerase [Gammaproteobacteria bacterium]|nr:MAG: 1-deoxy-D-xylulose-5-phosphate reductoisomerase [Gammaproteobacteria bacterium]